MKRRVVLFGLDGATYTVLDDLVRRGVMPFLGRFMQGGVRATLRSLEPPLTPIAWTTIATGRTPGHHGVLNFLQYESSDTRFVRMVTSRQVQCETIWSMVSRAGMRAGCLNFIAHNPPPKINGYVVPGWVPWRWLKNQSHPSDFISVLQDKIDGFDVKSLAMNFTEEEKAVAGTFAGEFDPWIDLHIERERQWFGILRYLLAEGDCDIIGVVFDGVDKLQHLLWRFLDPSIAPENPSPEYLRVRERCFDYFRLVDGFLEETVKLVGGEGRVFVVSDHGFTGSDEILYINDWLEQQGWLAWNHDVSQEDRASHDLGIAHPSRFQLFDMAKTKAFAATASNNGIHIPVSGVRGTEGIEPQAYEGFRRELISALKTKCLDPITGEPIVTDVWTREEIASGPHMHLAPDVTVALRDRGNFSVLRGGTMLKKREAVIGCHHPDGVFLAGGAGIHSGANIDSLRLVDVAPTLLHALGIDVSCDLEGRVATELYAAEHVRVAGVSLGPPTVVPDHVTADADDAEHEEQIDPQVLMRLKALGYIE